MLEQPETLLSQPVTINRTDGSSITFVKLAPSDRLKLRAAFRTQRKYRLLETLAIASVGGLDAVRVLNEFDCRRITEDEVIEWINEPEGQTEAVRLSMIKKKGSGVDDAEIDALALSENELLAAAAGVCNLDLVQRPKEGGNPLPDAAGEQTGMTATGGETQTSSEPTSIQQPNP